MPLKKKRKVNVKLIALIAVVVLAALMIISFSPAHNVTEIVLFP